MDAKFVIRNNRQFVNYAKCAWAYFLRNDVDGCKITIRRNNVFVHISRMYCVILNDISFIERNKSCYQLEMNKQAKMMLEKYNVKNH